MNQPEIKQSLRQFLATLPGTEGLADTSDGESLLEAGVIDSASMIELIAYIEKTYAFSIEDDEMTPENFETIEAIAGFINGRRADSDG